VSIWTEWDPLEEIIVGNCYQSGDLHNILPKEVHAPLDKIFDETKEDLDSLANYLNKIFGVKVHRPKVSKYDQELKFDRFVVNPMAPVIPRDQYLVYGDTIVQTYTSMPTRYLDSLNYYHIFKELFDRGHNWLSLPPPILTDLKETETWWTTGPEIYEERSNQLLWHTATMFKYGDRLLTNAAGPGTPAGLEWMRRVFGADTILSNNAPKNKGWGHIDGGMFNVRDDLVIAVTTNMIPSNLKDKKIIEIDGLFEKFDFKGMALDYKNTDGRYSKDWLEKWLNEWRGYAQDIAFDTNVLVVDPNNIIFTNNQPRLFKRLAKEGINCHVCHLRHGLFWESGIHCVTLDLVRTGKKRNILY
jgi:glycine amidinotransferase/scyllo-inosamine-4-phosphate amidinotransferase 1